VLDRLAVGIHSVDVDPGDPRILRIVVEQIQKVNVRPDIVADGDDAVNDNTGLGAFARDPAEIFAQRFRAVCNQRMPLSTSLSMSRK